MLADLRVDVRRAGVDDVDDLGAAVVDGLAGARLGVVVLALVTRGLGVVLAGVLALVLVDGVSLFPWSEAAGFIAAT